MKKIISLAQSCNLQISCVFRTKNNLVPESVILCCVYIVTTHLSKLAGLSNVSWPLASLRSFLLLSRKLGGSHHMVKTLK